MFPSDGDGEFRFWNKSCSNLISLIFLVLWDIVLADVTI